MRRNKVQKVSEDRSVRFNTEEDEEPDVEFEDPNEDEEDDLNPSTIEDLEEQLEEDLHAYLKKQKKDKPDFVDKNTILSILSDLQVRLPNGEPLPWEQTLALTAEKPIQVENVQDDVQRELAFYTQTMETVDKAFELCSKHNIPWERPDDYFAEMVKSDEHMRRVKGKLLFEKKRMDDIEERKRKKQMKKFGKQEQVLQKQQKEKEKKQNIETISKWRKARENGKLDEEEIPFEGASKPDGISNRQRKKAVRKRKLKDEKYGFGGRKRGMKRNDGSSLGDSSEFNPKRNREDVSKFQNRKGKKRPQGIKKRPGKNARTARFNKKR